MFKEPIHAVSVSIGYGDFLQESLKFNRHHFDKYIIVTSKDDKETRHLARQYNCVCLTTEDYKRDEAEFNKGRLIERGLMQLPANGWICHIDSDIVLPRAFRYELELAHLQKDKIYGCDRIM